MRTSSNNSRGTGNDSASIQIGNRGLLCSMLFAAGTVCAESLVVSDYLDLESVSDPQLSPDGRHFEAILQDDVHGAGG
ncbi:MAG TPA: hypothetical protein VF200_07230 [Woeseiaceae bacterium]